MTACMADHIVAHRPASVACGSDTKIMCYFIAACMHIYRGKSRLPVSRLSSRLHVLSYLYDMHDRNIQADLIHYKYN